MGKGIQETLINFTWGLWVIFECQPSFSQWPHLVLHKQKPSDILSSASCPHLWACGNLHLFVEVLPLIQGPQDLGACPHSPGPCLVSCPWILLSFLLRSSPLIHFPQRKPKFASSVYTHACKCAHTHTESYLNRPLLVLQCDPAPSFPFTAQPHVQSADLMSPLSSLLLTP